MGWVDRLMVKCWRVKAIALILKSMMAKEHLMKLDFNLLVIIPKRKETTTKNTQALFHMSKKSLPLLHGPTRAGIP